MDPRLLVSHLLFWIGDLWSKTFLFQTYGYGYGVYTTLMEWSLKLDDKGKIWKRPETPLVRRSKARKLKRIARKG